MIEKNIDRKKVVVEFLQKILNQSETATSGKPIGKMPAHIPSHLPSTILGKICHQVKGEVYIELSMVTHTLVHAKTMCMIDQQDIGKDCLVQFIDDDPKKPVVIGLIASERMWLAQELRQNGPVKGREYLELSLSL